MLSYWPKNIKFFVWIFWSMINCILPNLSLHMPVIIFSLQHSLWVFSFNGWKTVKYTHSCLVNSYEYPFHLKVLLCYIRSRRGTSYVKCIFKFLVCGHLLWCLVLPLKCGFVSLWPFYSYNVDQWSLKETNTFIQANYLGNPWSPYNDFFWVCWFPLSMSICGKPWKKVYELFLTWDYWIKK